MKVEDIKKGKTYVGKDGKKRLVLRSDRSWIRWVPVAKAPDYTSRREFEKWIVSEVEE